QRKHYTSMLKGECERQGALIGGLGELVALEKLSQKNKQCIASVTDLVPGIVSIYQPLATEKGIRLGYTVTADLPLIACPSNWLKQIIINLLDNCLKFTPSGGQVSVFVSLATEKVQLTFTDTGFGIAATDLKNIFNSFYRGRITGMENRKGAGLGLTIVHHLLLRCGGSISVTSKLEQGSTFKVLLPTLGDN
ncbi:MAG: HAMP domain-containing sensor histidine kinase, partial [Spirulinaceae cyanobacterium]